MPEKKTKKEIEITITEKEGRKLDHPNHKDKNGLQK